jgi:hypothetical protein
MVLGELERQVKLACTGVENRVKNAQTETGVKDSYTQYWIDYLIGRARDMKKENPQRSSEDIQGELFRWVDENKAKIYSSFFSLKGCIPLIILFEFQLLQLIIIHYRI